MKNSKKPIIFAITFVIAGLVIMSTASSFTFERQNVISDQSDITSCTEMSVSMDTFVCKPYQGKIVPVNPVDKLSRGEDILVMSSDIDCQNPAIVSDSSMNNILIFSEMVVDVSQINMFGRFSTDGGATWGEEIYGFEGVPEADPDSVSIPKLDISDGNEAWGTFTTGSKWDGMAYYMTIPDITDPSVGENGWSYYYADWADNSDFHYFDSSDVASFPYDPEVSPSDSFWGLVAGTGDRPPGTDYEDHSMWFSYFIPGDMITIISFYNMDNDAHKLVCDIDISKGRPFFAYEYSMEADPSDVGIRIVRCPVLRPDNYPDDNWWSGSFAMTKYADVLNPDIAAADSHVYVVGNTEDGNIKCYYSTNAGQNYYSSMVSEDSGDESYPQVTISGTDAICSYVRDGDLYAKTSKDGGKTWENEKLINDNSGSVVSQYGCNAVNGPFAAWTDEQSAIKEIYFDSTFKIGSSPETPTILGPTKLKPGQSKEYSFTTTDPDGDSVLYYVEWGDGSTLDWQGPYTSGTAFKASHSWSEKKGYTIRCKAKDVNGLESNYGTLDISTPRNSGLILRFLETLQHIFPNLWEICNI